jgi:hypothetical protein
VLCEEAKLRGISGIRRGRGMIRSLGLEVGMYGAVFVEGCFGCGVCAIGGGFNGRCDLESDRSSGFGAWGHEQQWAVGEQSEL